MRPVQDGGSPAEPITMGETPKPPARPVVALERVHARDAAGPRGRARGGLSGASMALGPGVHAVLGTPEDGVLALLDLVTGARSPLRGRVTVSGRDAAHAPSLRARIGVLAAEPRLPSAPTVRDAVRLCLRARGEAGDRESAVLDPLGLSHLHARAPRSLAFAEQRAVELALALSTPAPVLLALHEPLADVALPYLDLVSLRLHAIASAGACVLVTTSSPADARALAPHVLLLHRGLIVREVFGGASLALTEGITLEVWVRAGARELAAALSQRPEISGVSWREDAGDASVMEVRGHHTEPCALALIEVALEVGVEIEALVEEAPALGEVHAATATLWRMMHARSMHPRPPPPAAPSLPPAEVTSPPPAVPAVSASEQGAEP